MEKTEKNQETNRYKNHLNSKILHNSEGIWEEK